jgi:GTP-binding nuclear protein Ran
MQYYDISTYSTYNLEKPLLYLARKVLGFDSLNLVDFPAQQPKEVTIDLNEMRAFQSDTST